MSAAKERLSDGDSTRKLMIEGRERSYLLHVPPGLVVSEADKIPLVLAFHGSGTNARFMERFTGLSEKADEAGFVAAYPNGTGKFASALSFNGGNCCGYAKQENVDDVKFASAMLDDLLSVLPIDAERVYATGMSNGAMMCYRLADELASRIAAIGPIGGPMGSASCSPAVAVPVCHLHGDRDLYAPFAGGIGPRSISKTDFYSVEQTIGCWVQANGCDAVPIIEQLPAHVDDGTQITRQTYANGANGSEVVLYIVHGGGHTWPGRESVIKLLGKTTHNLQANDVLWEFFQRFRRQQAAEN